MHQFKSIYTSCHGDSIKFVYRKKKAFPFAINNFENLGKTQRNYPQRNSPKLTKLSKAKEFNKNYRNYTQSKKLPEIE